MLKQDCLKAYKNTNRYEVHPAGKIYKYILQVKDTLHDLYTLNW